MKNIVFFFFAFFIAQSISAQSPSAKVDLEQLANRLVNQCADIQENEIVLVSGSVRDLELLENIAVNVRKVGAFPLITIDSDRMTRRMFTDVPEKYDAQIPLLDLQLVNTITTQISLPVRESPDLLADINPKRFAVRNEAAKPINEIYEFSNIKLVNLGNGLYPTKALAEEFNISMEKLTEIFWNGVNTDNNVLKLTGEKLKSILDPGEEVKITNKNGTNLTAKITTQEAYIYDGSISKSEQQNGISGNSVFLPAGEVMVAVDQGSANGKVVIDNLFVMGHKIKDLTLDFSDGKLVSMNAESGLEYFKNIYDVQGERKDEFSFLDFGINPNVVIPEESNLKSWVPAGVTTIGIGNNVLAGGDNDAPTGYSFFVPGCTVTVDGKIIIEEGKLKQ